MGSNHAIHCFNSLLQTIRLFGPLLPNSWFQQWSWIIRTDWQTWPAHKLFFAHARAWRTLNKMQHSGISSFCNYLLMYALMQNFSQIFHSWLLVFTSASALNVQVGCSGVLHYVETWYYSSLKDVTIHLRLTIYSRWTSFVTLSFLSI
jgi:hypothetical protein